MSLNLDQPPLLPTSAPFTPEQRAWLNGYIAARFASSTQPLVSPVATIPKPSLLILYGSQTGTAEALARRLLAEAGQKGFAARLFEANAFEKAGLASDARLLLITSTWGEGDPPDNALQFWKHLASETAPKLASLSHAVLSLGDRNYADFCGAGRKFDERLRELGSKSICARLECDGNPDSASSAWCQSLWSALSGPGTAAGEPSTGSLNPASTLSTAPSKPIAHGRENPFLAPLTLNRRLNGSGSAKETRHYEFSLEGSQLSYEAGDALGVVPTNCPDLVKEFLGALGFDGEEAVKDPNGAETSLGRALLHSYQITQPPMGLMKLIAERSQDTQLRNLLLPDNAPALEKFLAGREIIDLVLASKPTGITPEELVACLRKLNPRLYSISSSPKAHAGQVHLTVNTVRYETLGRIRRGVCSTFLADRVPPGSTVPIFVQKSPNFRLPSDGSRPVIMVGPGTGIAPFRAFLHERQACGHGGKNWLFFGDQSAATDFLYRDELARMQQDSHLSRLDTAFSRDQLRKIYVQDRMKENASELWRWLEEGAHFYVCGDAKRMAKDVDSSLQEIIQSGGGRSAEAAAAYVQTMKSDKRYQRDVY